MHLPEALAHHSPWSRLDPRVKLSGIILLVVTISFLNREAPIILALGVAGFLLFSTCLPAKHVLTIASPMIIILLGVSLASFLTFSPAVALIQIGRVVACMGLALWLGLTTPLTGLLEAARRLGLPRLMTLTGLFMARYLSVIHKESHTLQKAHRARGMPGGTSLRDRLALKRVGYLTGEIFVRSHRRGRRSGLAVRARTSRQGLAWAPVSIWSGTDTAFLIWVLMVFMSLVMLQWVIG